VDARRKLRAGDVLLSKSGTIGKAGVVRNGAVGAVAASGLFILRSDQNRLDPHFLAAYLESSECRSWLDGNARGATIRHLSKRVLDDMPIPVPPLQFQHRVVAQYRHQRMDVLTFMALLVTEGEDDPIVQFLDHTLSSLTSERGAETNVGDVEPLFSSGNFYGAFRRLIGPGYLIEARESALSVWFHAITKAVKPLKAFEDIPPSPASYSLLQQALVGLREAEEVTTGNLPNEKKAHEIAQIIRNRVSTTIENLARDLHVTVFSKINTLRHDEYSNIDLTLVNQGALPIRDLRIWTKPDWGQAHKGYLPEGSDIDLSVSGVTPGQGEKFSLQIGWSGLSLSGVEFRSQREISFDLIESADAESVEFEGKGGSPYVCGDPVGPERSDVFFGRGELLEQIRRQVIQSGNVVLLEGNRRSGKSSILRHLEGADAVPGWLGVYCSFQKAKGSDKSTGIPTVEVFRLIAESVSKAIYRSVDMSIPLPDGETPPQSPKLSINERKRFGIAVRESISEGSSFSDFCDYIEIVMEELAGKELGLLLMLDEFDKLQEGIDNKVTSPQVPENIRYLIQSYPRVSAILTGLRRLKRLREEYWSMLFGLGTRFSVTSLPEEPAKLLITEPIKRQFTYTQEAINKAIYLTAGQPYLLQCLCNRVFDMSAQLKIRSVSIDLVNQAGDELVEDNEHFAAMWDYATSDRRRFILALCHRHTSGPDPLRLGVIQERLIAYGIEMNDETLIADLEFLRELELIDLVGETGGGHYILSVPLMGTWIERQQDFAALMSNTRLETEDQYE